MQLLKSFHKTKPFLSERGFTLIEIITVILLLGIIGVMGSDIISTTFRGFAQTDDAMELFEEGKLALMRMEREIHHMVPNAINDPTNASSIDFGIIDVNTLNNSTLAGQYEPVGATLMIRDISNNLGLAANTFISIYNTSWTDFSNLTATSRKIYQIGPVAGPNMTLDKAVVGGHSATKRFYPIQGIIRYEYNAATGILSRNQAAVSLAGNLSNALGAAPAYPLLSHITALSFNYTPASLTSNALVRINFTLARNGTTLNFHKEIQVRNVP